MATLRREDRLRVHRVMLPTIAVAASILIAAAGCAAPKYRYVKNSTTGTYLKIPRTWAEFSSGAIADAQVRVLQADAKATPTKVDTFDDQISQWRMAFDADKVPSAEHAIDIAHRVSSLAPVVDVRVVALNDTQRDRISLSDLRNLFIDYDTKKKAAQDAAATKPVTDPTVSGDFRPISEQELAAKGGLHGIRLQFELRTAPPDNLTFIFDQTALIDSTSQRLYVLMMRGEENEFLKNAKMLNDIAESFTVKPKN